VIAALYVETGGVYYGLPDVDPWDEERDARLYAGPWPVVAHPPCARWCRLAPMLEEMHGAGYEVGNDGGCFTAALAAVRTWGGVLEHPAESIAWRTFHLPRPSVFAGWTQTFLDEGWVTQVSQAAYGHRAEKLTWFYYVGSEPPPALDWSRPEPEAMVSSFGHGEKVPESYRVRPSEASRTTPAFRDVLLDMARSSNFPQIAEETVKSLHRLEHTG
jgi:hypothetical protein